MRTIILSLLSVGLISTASAQIGFAETASLSNDSMVLVSVAYLAQLERHQYLEEDDFVPRAPQGDQFVDNVEAMISALDGDQNLQLELPYDREMDLRVVKITGEEVMSMNKLFGSNQINLSHLKTGTYYVQLVGGSNAIRKRINR